VNNEIVLGLLTFLTSTITASIGAGGGMILIALLPSFLPTVAIIPVHGITQLASNISRAALVYKDIQYQVIPKFLLGSLLGIMCISSVIYFISLNYVPLFIGLYILLTVWSQKFNERIERFESYFLIGFFQTGLSIVVGAAGPLSLTLLLKEFGNYKNKIVATQAALTSLTHILKVFTFIFLGFVFIDYIWVVIYMIMGAALGSYVGTLFRNKIDEKKFKNILKIVLTILAIKAIYSVL
jgi:uncharacterized membrane protein YfcA